MSDNLGVGFAKKLMTRGNKLPPKLTMVLNNAVVYHHDIARSVRVGVLLGGRSVRGPACMPYPDGAVQWLTCLTRR